jgi:hypothetical protein
MSSARGSTPPAIPKRDLVNPTNRLLSGLASLRVAAKAGADDAFEYWLWARNISAARQPGMGLAVQLKGLHGGRIRLRTSPSSVSAGSYSHAEISSSTNLVELHTGVYIEGGSGAQHEVDVAAIDAGAGISPVGHASLRWGFEAKLYAATLPLSIPRAVLGTAYDLKALSAYHHHGPPRLALVSSAPLSMTGRTLLAYKHYSHPRVPAAESVRIGRSWAVDSFVRQHLSRL